MKIEEMLEGIQIKLDEELSDEEYAFTQVWNYFINK